MSLFVQDRIILDLCGGTGAWSQPYKEAGYDVRLVTLPDEDVRLFKVPEERVWGILAAPPCTEFAVSGARWWEGKSEELLVAALSIVDACLRIITVCEPQWWALGNPVGRLVHYIGPPRLTFNPCDYGDPWTKRTLLWGQFKEPELDPVEPEFIEAGGKRFSKFAYLPPSEDRAKLRAITPPGFARAFFEANQ